MEIDITDLFYGDTWPLAGSIATHGADAGPSTWNASLAEAAENPILKTETELQALRDHVQAMGFGDDVQAYDAQQCNALMVQLVSLDKRENGLDDVTPDDDETWMDYESDENVSHSIYRSADRVFYSLEH